MAGAGSRSQTTTLFLVICAKLVFGLVLPTRESSTMGALVTTVISEAGLHRWESRVPNRTKFIHRTQIELESSIRQSRLLPLHFNSLFPFQFSSRWQSHTCTQQNMVIWTLFTHPIPPTHHVFLPTSCIFYYNPLCPVNIVLTCTGVQPSPWLREP